MKSTRLQETVHELFLSWFSENYRVLSIDITNIQSNLVQYFLRSPKVFKVPAVPIHNIEVIKQEKTKFSVKDISDISAILPYRFLFCLNSKTLNSFFLNWKQCKNWLTKVYFKKTAYNVGYGILLDENFKPLIIATYSVSTFRQKKLTQWYYGAPTINIAPELMDNPVWKPIILKYFIPACSQPISTETICSNVPKKCKNTEQTITIQIRDLSEFMLAATTSLKLTENVTEVLNEEAKKLKQLPLIF